MKQNYIVGIDIGGTKIKGALWNGGKITRGFDAKTPKTKKEFVAVLNNLFAKLSNGKLISAIGIGSAGIISGNKIVWSTNIPYLKNFNFRYIFKRPIKLKTDNDARSFLRGEYKIGAGRKANKIMGVTIGTGIGRAYGENDETKKIKKLEYPEKWEKEYQRISGNDERLAEFLAENLSPLLKKYNPEIIIFGGGVIDKKNFFEKLKIKLTKKGVKITIKKAALGNYSAAIGAALLFKQNGR